MSELSSIVNLEVLDNLNSSIILKPSTQHEMTKTGKKGKVNPKLNCNACSQIKTASKKCDDFFINMYPGKSVKYKPGGMVFITSGYIKSNGDLVNSGVKKLIFRYLKESGLMGNYHIMPGVKCSLDKLYRLYKGEKKILKVTPKLYDNCTELSIKLLKDHYKPGVVVIDSPQILKRLTGLKISSLTRVVNRVLWSSDLNCFIIPTINLTYFHLEKIKSDNNKFESVKDSVLLKTFKMAKKIVDNEYVDNIYRVPSNEIDYRKLTISSTEEEINRVFKMINECKTISVDIETTGLELYKDLTTMVGIGYAPGKAYVFSSDFLHQYKEKFQEVFNNPTIEKVFANGYFDVTRLMVEGFTFKGTMTDVLGYNYLLRNGLECEQWSFALEKGQVVRYGAKERAKGTGTLKYLAWVYTDLGGYEEGIASSGGIASLQKKRSAKDSSEEVFEEFDEDQSEDGELFEVMMKKSINPNANITLRDSNKVKLEGEVDYSNLEEDELYNAQDCDATLRIKYQLEKVLPQKLYDFYHDYLGPLNFEVLSRMTVRGIGVDVTLLEDMTHKYDDPETGLLHSIEKEFMSTIRGEMIKSKLTLKGLHSLFGKHYQAYEESVELPDKAEYINQAPIKITSPTALLKLYKAMGYLDEKEGSLDDSVLKELRKKSKSAELKLDYQQPSKFFTTYVHPLLTKSKEGRVHANFNGFFTNTGRLSSSGPNMQNIPGDNSIRNIFIAREGFSFLDFDYGQIELRVLAAKSGDANMLRAFREGLDPHWETAKLMFHIPLDYRPNNSKAEDINDVLAVTKIGDCYTQRDVDNYLEYADKNSIFELDYTNKALRASYDFTEDEHFKKWGKLHLGVMKIAKWEKHRYEAKTLNFTILYGAGPKGVASLIYPDFDHVNARTQAEYKRTCRGLIDTWFETKPRVREWMDNNFKLCQDKRYVENVYGRRRWLIFSRSNYSDLKSSAQREAGNTPIQSTASDICGKAAIELTREFLKHPERECGIVNLVHDNILAEVPDEYKDYYFELTKDVMENWVNPFKDIVPLDVDGKITKKWEK